MITFFSCLVTIFAICNIFGTTVELQKYNANVTINKRTMIIHIILLTLQSLVAVFAALELYIQVLFNYSQVITIVMTAVDLIVQLMICYICLTMGSHVHLRKF